MKKVIVTGGCGYIGSHTVVELIDNGFEVVIFDNLSNSKEFLDRIQQITGVSPKFELVDLSNSRDADEAYKKHADASSIINFAAYKAVGESIEKPIQYYQNNLYALINTIEAQKKYGIKNFIFSSSATVYGDPDSLPLTENHETKKAFSPYANTKKIAEEILADCSRSYSDLNSISLRYFNPIGAHSSGLIGELPNGVPNNLLPYVTQCAAGVLNQLQVFGDDYNTKDGTCVRDYIHVYDLAHSHIRAAELLLYDPKGFEAINLGTGRGYSSLQIMNTAVKVAGKQLDFDFADRRPGDPPALFADNSLARQRLDFEAKYSDLETILSTAWKWHQSKPDGYSS